MKRYNIYLSELEQDYRREMRGDDDATSESELEALYENLDEPELRMETDEGNLSEYGQRFYEISVKSFESDDDRESAVREALDDMERDYFFKKIFRKIKRGGLKGLASKALRLAGTISKIPGVGNMIPGLSTITQLARGNLKGALGSLAAQGLNLAIPGSGAIAGPALAALGFGEVDDPQSAGREWWNRYAEVAQRSMENLADSVTANIDSVMEASQAATSAFQNAVKNTRSGYGRIHHDSKVVRLRRGQRVIIEAE